MAKKVKKRKMVETHDGEDYLFLGGKAKVPGGFLISGKPVYITRRQFNELAK